MANVKSLLAAWSPRVLSVMRMMIGLLFAEHGCQKLLGFPPPSHAMEGPMTPLILVAGLLEFFGGLLVAIGLFTRPTAFILSGMMAVAYFMAHAPQGFFPVVNGGELAVIYCFVFLYLASAGGGAWSLDALWRRGATGDRSAIA